MPSTSSISDRSSKGSLASRSNLLIKVNIGMCFMTHTLNSFMVWASTPFEPSITITAESAAISVRYVSSEKSWCPGVSRIFMTLPPKLNCMAEDVTEIPLSFSISIQSETACFAAFLPFTVPARFMAPPYSRNFSVRVVLPASGWDMMANVLLFSISSLSLLLSVIPFSYI